MIIFLRTIRFAFQSFWRNLWLSLVTIFILTLTMLSLSLVAGVNMLTNQALSLLQDKVNVDLFFTPGLEEQTILGYQAELEAYSETEEVVYVSQEEALHNFLVEHSADPTIKSSIESLNSNPFPASLIVKAHELDQYDPLITKIEQGEMNQHIQSKDFADNRVIINSINSLIKKVSQIGIVISMIFILISVIMIFNTIRIAIYAHRDELNIMKLVGATNWFIRGPFLIESVIYGLISALITTALVVGLLLGVYPYAGEFFVLTDTSASELAWKWLPTIILSELALGCMLSLVSTGLALRRYLKA